MIPFLKQVASAYYRRGTVENTCFIFPNRRSEVFFTKYLAEAVVERDRNTGDAVPLAVPWTCTVNDFIYRIYGTAKTDRITLLLELYGIYSGLYDKAEPLDDFVFWGDIILGDFNDLDKYLADASQLFTNVSDLRSIQDSYSYLTDRQRAAIKSFTSHFSDRGGRLTVDLESDNPKVKERFLQIWNILYPLYRTFRKTLEGKGLAYEGMVYRGVAERFLKEDTGDILEKVYPGVSRFVFIGLNALNECEKTILRQMKSASLAEFCWDYAGNMIRDRYNRSSFFMEQNIREFPQSAVFGNDSPALPSIHVVSVPSSVGQTKLLPRILEEIARKRTSGDMSKVGVLGGPDGADCAVVLPDETLLMPLLNSVPPEIKDINVTMGYPMTASAFYLFMDLVIDIQMNIRKKGSEYFFYYKPVHALFSDSIFRTASDPGTEKAARDIKAAARLFIPASSLATGGLMSAVFRPVVSDKSVAGTSVTDSFAGYLLSVIEAVVPALRAGSRDSAEIEFAMEYHKSVSVLRRIQLPVKPQTYVRILKRILSPVSVPFKGEPLQGLQVMGPLETRALDFSNIVVMSVNEGTFPGRSISSSFIPPELRRGFGLPTYEYQDAVWAYYFYRMISRASDVWLLYDSRTEGLRSGEESRYIKQLRYHFDVPLERSVVTASLSGTETGQDSIPKTEENVAVLRSFAFSASSLQEYLSCQAKFYYRYIQGLGKENEVVEVLDPGLFGTVFHEIMHTLYLGEDAMASSLSAGEWVAAAPDGVVLKEITSDYIASWLRRTPAVKNKVRNVVMRELHAQEITGRNLVIVDVIVRYVMKTLSVDLDMLEKNHRKSFRLAGLERNFRFTFNGFTFKGIIDRIDSIDPDRIRIVDYKTGTVKPEDVGITAANAEAVADAVFGDDNARRPKIALQLYIYDKAMADEAGDRAIDNSIYSTRGLFTGAPATCPAEPAFIRAMDERLAELLGQMSDPDIPFRRTEDVSVCGYCDFKSICGR